MASLFRPKCLRRIILFLIVMFPMFYFFFGLVFSLNGSHGTLSLNDDFSSGVTFWDYLFSAPFANNNFISSLGYSVLNAEEVGFLPFGMLIRYLDSNFFNFGSSDSIALFVYGYAYYAVNVLLLYEVVILVIKLLLIPLRVVEMFDRKGD